MLPLRRDSLIVGIARGQLEWVRCHGIFAQKVIAHGIETLDEASLPSIEWQKSIFARMRECATRPEWENVDVTVILSSDMVRYLAFIVPKEIRRIEELHAYAQHQFTQVYGNDAQQWQIRLHFSKKLAYLTCALDPQWLAELRTVFQDKQHLVSIRPVLMASFNLHRKALPSNSFGWYVCYENYQFTYALFGDGQWQYVQTRRGNQVSDLLLWLDRENLSGRLPQPCREIWLDSTVPHVTDDATYNFHVFPCPVSQGIDPKKYALASLGVS